MPRTTVYIRNEDYEFWKSVPNKSQWISYHLANDSQLKANMELNMKVDKQKLESFRNLQKTFGTVEPVVVPEDQI